MKRSSALSVRLRPVVALLVAALCLLPFAYLLLLSVVESWAFPRLVPGNLQLRLWMRVLTGASGLAGSFVQSVLISSTVAFIATLAGFLTGKFVAYHPRRRGLLFLAYVPFVMSPVILGTCLMYLYLQLHLVGTTVGVIAAQSMFAYGFSIVLFSAFWNDRLQAYEALVHTLGGSSLQALWRVLLPMARPMLLICFFQTFLISWFQYGLTLLIGAGKVQTLPLRVFAYVNEANMYYAALASCLLVLPPALLLWLNKRLLFRQTASGPV
ncbi:ABC transporter permease [Salisaeta longa]|uniref:ABC transporter permease n=1 Tax=Salisaeta longa TaxID=503170 RepID=UPI0003B5ABDE|nr:ABC transporter permease subunit [Salisaeta longa]